jgi:hypothetical protein
MKPIVVLGMAQPYPGYGCEQVTIVASRIPDTIVALVKHVTILYFGILLRSFLFLESVFHAI